MHIKCSRGGKANKVQPTLWVRQWHRRVAEYLKSKHMEDGFSEGFCIGFFRGPESHLFHCLRKYSFKLKHYLFKLEYDRLLERIGTQHISQSD